MINAKGGDWSHVSAVSAIPDDTTHTDPFSAGNVIISIRHQNTVAIIDRTTSQIVWVNTDFFIGPHSTHMIRSGLPGADNILGLDNGFVGEWLPLGTLLPIPFNRDHSKVWEIIPVPNFIEWSYEDTDAGLRPGAFFTRTDGGAQRLSNGNTLITEAQYGRVFEVAVGLETVWEYVSPFYDASNSNAIYRAYKMPLDWAGPHFVPDLVVSGDDGPDPVGPGDDLIYTIQVENAGPDPAVSVELTAATPVGTTFQSVSAPLGWSCSTPAVGGTGPITCTASNLSTSSAAVFTTVFEIDPCSGGFQTIGFTATASSLGSDATPGDNSTTINTLVGCP
jgi:uncharacterized repeat protein (TIGR01451 family)